MSALTGWHEMFNDRVLTAAKRHGYWTVIDRDTGALIGPFGLEVQKPTCEEALVEAERFGSKWGWPTDREAVRDKEAT